MYLALSQRHSNHNLIIQISWVKGNITFSSRCFDLTKNCQIVLATVASLGKLSEVVANGEFTSSWLIKIVELP